MASYVDKTQKHIKQRVTNVAVKKHNDGESGFHFFDNRSVAILNNKIPTQRKMVFGGGTEDLDASVEKNGITDSSFIKVQTQAKEIEPKIILALNAATTSEQAKFQSYGAGGLISIKPLPDESSENYGHDQSARLIAVTHETQHALDHLSPDSALHGELNKLTGEKGVRTELHAFAAQAAETQQLIGRGKPVARTLKDMAEAFIESTPKSPTKFLMDIMQFYAWHYSNKYKEQNPNFESVKDSETLILATEKYIASYMDESKAIYKSLLKD